MASLNETKAGHCLQRQGGGWLAPEPGSHQHICLKLVPEGFRSSKGSGSEEMGRAVLGYTVCRTNISKLLRREFCVHIKKVNLFPGPETAFTGLSTFLPRSPKTVRLAVVEDCPCHTAWVQSTGINQNYFVPGPDTAPGGGAA